MGILPNLLDSAVQYGLIADPGVAIEEGSPITIAELTGRKRSLRLSGRAMPVQKIPFSGTMRCEQTWYPGSPIATLQLLGSTEDETTISGKWSDRFLSAATDPEHRYVQVAYGETGGESFVASVMALVKLVDDFRLQGQLLRVTWDEIAREGILSKFKQDWHRRSDCDWEMTFMWQSQGIAPAHVAAPAPSTSDNLNSVLHFAQDLFDTVNKYYNYVQTGLAVAQDVITSINAAITRLEYAIASLEDAAAMVETTSVESGRRAAAVFKYIGDTASDLIHNVDDTPPRNVMSSKRPDQLPAGSVVASENWLRQMRNRARTVRNFAYTKAYEHSQGSDPTDLIRVFRARDGQDLRDVSKLFYNTPEEWKSLMQFNRMTGSKLVIGQLVYVPRQPMRNG